MCAGAVVCDTAENAENAGNAPDPNAAPPGAETSQDDLRLILWDLAQTRHLSESQRLANLIQGEFNETLKLKDRGVKQAPFRVLMGAAMPAVLVEVGFLSNPEEEGKLQDADYRSDLVESLVRAVTRYKPRATAPGGARRDARAGRGGAARAPRARRRSCGGASRCALPPRAARRGGARRRRGGRAPRRVHHDRREPRRAGRAPRRLLPRRRPRPAEGLAGRGDGGGPPAPQRRGGGGAPAPERGPRVPSARR